MAEMFIDHGVIVIVSPCPDGIVDATIKVTL